VRAKRGGVGRGPRLEHNAPRRRAGRQGQRQGLGRAGHGGSVSKAAPPHSGRVAEAAASCFTDIIDHPRPRCVYI
jgi:hypothetical protein